MKPTMVLSVFAMSVVLLSCSTERMAESPVPGVCVHLASPWSTYECPEAMMATSSTTSAAKVDSVTITVWSQGKKEYHQQLGDSIDAVFFGKTVIDTILVNYYYGKKSQADSQKAIALTDKVKNFPGKSW